MEKGANTDMSVREALIQSRGLFLVAARLGRERFPLGPIRPRWVLVGIAFDCKDRGRSSFSSCHWEEARRPRFVLQLGALFDVVWGLGQILFAISVAGCAVCA